MKHNVFGNLTFNFSIENVFKEKIMAQDLKQTQHLRENCLKRATFSGRQIKCPLTQVNFIGISSESFAKNVI